MDLQGPAAQSTVDADPHAFLAIWVEPRGCGWSMMASSQACPATVPVPLSSSVFALWFTGAAAIAIWLAT